MIKRIGMMAIAALTLAGCGAKHTIVNPVDPMGQITQVSPSKTAAAATSANFDENKFWADYPTQVSWVTIKSQATDYMVVQMSALELGFNQGAKVFFPITVQNQVQFSSNLFLGTDKGLYISQLGNGSATDLRFYRIGSYGVRSLEFTEGDTIKIRLDPGFNLNVKVMPAAAVGAAPSLGASIDVQTMPDTVLNARLFTRPSAAAAPAS